MAAGLYIHVPFCESRCDYCSFYSHVPEKREIVDRYVDALISEIGSKAKIADGDTFDTIYFGGGTPSILSLSQIMQIMHECDKLFRITPDAEITLETNPVHFSLPVFRELVDRGINRFSMGVQTLDQGLYRLIGRKGGYASEKILDDYFSLKARLSLDFICGIMPEQNIEEELSRIFCYDPRHLSVYLLSVDEGTPLSLRFPEAGDYDLFQLESYRHVSKLLRSRGFDHYEVSNFARLGEYSRHNMKYWDGTAYLGLGPGAHSFWANKRFANGCDIKAYLKEDNVVIRDERDADELKTELIMTGLRTRGGVDEQRYHQLTGTFFDERLVAKCLERSDVAITGEKGRRHISLAPDDWPLLDTIVYEIAEHLLD